MRNNFGLFILFIFILVGCSKKAVVRFTQKKPELTSADVLTEIMLVTKSPRIVLRVPNTRKGVTNTQGTGIYLSQNTRSKNKWDRTGKAFHEAGADELQYDETALYNTIEKQLFKEGFSVRDRGLFNQVLDDNTNVDYSKINALTNTDLILELVKIDSQIGYTTNVCYLDVSDEQKLINDYRDMRGAAVEFKLVYVKTNEIVGTYKIHYTPCTEGCRGIYKKGGSRGAFTNFLWTKPGEKEALRKLNSKAFQYLDQDALELFIADATHQLVQTMR
ncbi:hypothetical protein ACFQ4C_02255 [Larkinella insperata]|uniref:Lipoprotein n=1 Tax=Larkinella insperata TaxID=332158 RepID=A0ABW3Q6E4_9BACT|nr:hypothetical protein [Larkinella insperata]